jgi:hypothetical protein
MKGEGERKTKISFFTAPPRLGVLAVNPFVPIARRFRF